MNWMLQREGFKHLNLKEKLEQFAGTRTLQAKLIDASNDRLDFMQVLHNYYYKAKYAYQISSSRAAMC